MAIDANTRGDEENSSGGEEHLPIEGRVVAVSFHLSRITATGGYNDIILSFIPTAYVTFKWTGLCFQGKGWVEYWRPWWLLPVWEESSELCSFIIWSSRIHWTEKDFSLPWVSRVNCAIRDNPMRRRRSMAIIPCLVKFHREKTGTRHVLNSVY